MFANDSLVDDKGRRIMWAWACESREAETQRATGWSGVMTMPRVLSLGEDGTMRINPPAELARLRMNPRRQEDVVVPDGGAVTLDGIAGDSLELSLEVDLGEASEFGVKVRCSPDGTEETVILCDVTAGVLKIDSTQSSLSEDIFQPFPYPQAAYFPKKVRQSKDIRVQEAPFQVQPGERLELRIFLDRSVLEIFANGRQCVTQRIYPSRADSKQIRLFCKGGAATVRSLQAWDMASANGF